MATLRRLKFLGVFLALILLSGAVPSSAALWQCRHAARIVGAAFTASAAAMPCRPGGKPMPRMICCPAPAAAMPRTSRHHASLTPPPCRPTLLRLAVLPCARIFEAQPPRHRAMTAAVLPALPLFASCLPPVPDTLSWKQRPPPTFGSLQSLRLRTPGLRAPPAA